MKVTSILSTFGLFCAVFFPTMAVYAIFAGNWRMMFGALAASALGFGWFLLFAWLESPPKK